LILPLIEPSIMRKRDFTADSPGQLESIPEGADAFVPDPLPPPAGSIDLAAHMTLADEAAFALGGLNHAVSSTPGAALLVDSFLRREAVRSSKIEGTRTQLGQLLMFEIGETESEFTDAVDAEQVERNLQAIHRGLELTETLPLCGRLFREIHGVLFEGTSKILKMPGEYRASSTRIGGRDLGTIKESYQDARFIPPPHSRIAQCMKDLEDFINLPEKNEHLPIVVQMALVHYQFETIHPFCDGNGRIGRLITSLLLKARGRLLQPILCLSAYMDENRDAYTDLMLAVSQKGDWDRWINFFLTGIREQAKEDTARCAELVRLHDQYLDLCDSHKIPIYVTNSLFSFPVTSITRLRDIEGVSHPTASRWVDALEGNGVLKEMTGRSTNRIYMATQIVRALE
jgi:Fic family protein